MNGPVKRGRPKKKPGYCREDQISKLINRAVELYQIPYDDRDERDPDAPTIEAVAAAMGTTPVRVRKMLVTAEYFSTEISRKVLALHKAGCSVAQIMEKTGLGEASIYSYLPYTRGVYNLEDPTVYAEQNRLFRKRRMACETLAEHMGAPDVCDFLWEVILAFEGYPFCTGSGNRVKYSIDCDQICFGGIPLTKEEIIEAFHRMRKAERVTTDCLGCRNAEELFAVFLRIGACECGKD